MLTIIQLLGLLEVLQVLVIRDDFNWELGSFELRSEVLKTTDDAKHLFVVDVIASFSWSHGFGHKTVRV